MSELVKQLNRLCKVTSNLSHDLHELIIIERGLTLLQLRRVWDPEGNVLVAEWVLAVWLELRDLSLLELLQEPFILTPE